MLMSPLLGNLPETDKVFYIAADENYFNDYGKPLISSIRKHFTEHIHFHLYNPSEDTLNFCATNSVSYSYEYFNHQSIDNAFQIYKNLNEDEELNRRRSKMIKLGENVEKIRSELVRTYYACARFIRLDQLLSKPTYVVMLDTDSLVRRKFSLPQEQYDIHIFEKTHKKHVDYVQHLASTVFYTGTVASRRLIKDHARLILEEFEKDTLYWFLDQETLDIVIQKYRKKSLPQEFVDFDLQEFSYIWCAKGPRKNLAVWRNEISKFQDL